MNTVHFLVLGVLVSCNPPDINYSIEAEYLNGTKETFHYRGDAGFINRPYLSDGGCLEYVSKGVYKWTEQFLRGYASAIRDVKITIKDLDESTAPVSGDGYWLCEGEHKGHKKCDSQCIKCKRLDEEGGVSGEQKVYEIDEVYNEFKQSTRKVWTSHLQIFMAYVADRGYKLIKQSKD